LFRSGLRHAEALARLNEMEQTPELAQILDFLRNSGRGLISAE
jgi:hypothetical protein